jgi:ABC-type nickel/cobalt efflux system permease component RcnA
VATNVSICRCSVQSNIPNPDTAPKGPGPSNGTASEPPIHEGPVVYPGPKTGIDLPGTGVAIPKFFLYAGALLIALVGSWCCWRCILKRRRKSRRRNKKRRRSKYTLTTSSEEDWMSERDVSAYSAARSSSTSLASDEGSQPVRKRHKQMKHRSGHGSRELKVATSKPRARPSPHEMQSSRACKQKELAKQKLRDHNVISSSKRRPHKQSGKRGEESVRATCKERGKERKDQCKDHVCKKTSI